MNAVSMDKGKTPDRIAASIEVSPKQAIESADLPGLFPKGVRVYITDIGSDSNETLVAAARRVHDLGYTPVPHFASRRLTTRSALEDRVKAMTAEAGVHDVLVIGGGLEKQAGEFSSTMEVLETGFFDKYGVTDIGVAGHPEGSPDIAPAALAEALAWKNAFAERSDASFYIATQFCFEAAPIIAWDKAMQAAGNRLPIHIGVPGLATIKTLINHAKACGVGPSMRFLTRQARNVAKLMTVNAPDKLLLDLARYKALDPDCGIARLHIYPLGGLKRSAAWTYAVADGDFEINPKGNGFKVTREID